MPRSTQNPLISFETGGKATILKYEMPTPSSYTGNNLLELDIPTEWFLDSITQDIPKTSAKKIVEELGEGKLEAEILREAELKLPITGLVPLMVLTPAIIARTSSSSHVIGTNPGNPAMGAMVAEEVRHDSKVISSLAVQGQRLVQKRKLSGKEETIVYQEPEKPDPKIIIKETYGLTSYLGNYGAGRTVKTFTLLPGEETTISVNTWKRSETTRKEASSILDSYTDETADEFESSVQSENSRKEKIDESFGYKIEAEAEASWGFGSASVKGSVEGSSNSSREEFSKNVCSAAEKHVSKKSAKREVEINTSYESKDEEGIETSTTRVLKNLNVSRVLNFVFRQMNQEFITYLHLKDVRVAFTNGFSGSWSETPLYELEEFLEGFLKASLPDGTEPIKEVTKYIEREFKAIFDYNGNKKQFIERRSLPRNEYYLRVKPGALTTDTDYKFYAENTDGIIIRKTVNIICTDGVVVDALLGQGVALDDYALSTQNEVLRSKKQENDLKELEVKKLALGLDIVETEDQTKADLYQKLFGPLLEQST